jgi:tetratricopeptide (TPR) repeat protein
VRKPGLLLRAVDVAGPMRWRWLVTDEGTGEQVADYQVDLESVPGEVARFRDLYGYVRSYAAPDRPAEDGARIVADAGAWAGHALLGETVGAAIVAAAPVTVRVSVPAIAEPVLLWPLELAHVDGRPLAARGDVAFVYEIGDHAGRAGESGGAAGAAGRKDRVGVALRVLAVFAQPTRTSVLALRRERYALGRLIRRIAARERAVVELRVAQYGVTRERLAEIADDADGWDVLHLSGHGAGGLFLLEQPDGSPDPVSTADLAGLLRRGRRRVKLAVVSACESAADTTAQTLRLIGLQEQADALEAAEAAAGGQRPAQLPGLAQALVRELECAVVAMRYPVTDEFAMRFGDVFYERLLSRQQSVDVAVARAVAEAAGPAPSGSRPAVSLASAGAFGRSAAGLKLAVPRGLPRLDPAEQKMAYFPDEPERFVGRLDVMAAAGAALASGSGRMAVLLHGMAGGGKTASAVELAYQHQDSFAAAAFWPAPTREDGWEGALADFTSRLEIQLGGYGFTLATHTGTVAAFEEYLPRLRRLLGDTRLLVVLDNLETLLTRDGAWRDPRWGLLITALTGHGGESRVILTSRILPSDPGAAVVTLPVHSLSLEESAALARELPNLRGLLRSDPGPFRTAPGVDADRGRVLRVLRVVQGHPKLLELADAAAADREKLDEHLAVAEAAVAGQELEAFFRGGTSVLDPDQFLNALSGWTVTALAALPEPVRLMAGFLVCLEDGDRRSDVVDMNWPYLWEQLGCPGDAPAPGPLLAVLAAAALARPEMVPASAGEDEPDPLAYLVHPGVAAAIAAAAGVLTREAVDAVLAEYWYAVAYHASEQEDQEDSGLVVRAGLAAVPYLLRRGEYDTAATLLDHAIVRDESPGTAQAVLPALRRIAAATGTPEDTGVLARALSRVDRAEAERLLRAARDAAVDAGDYRAASRLAGDLASLLRQAGRLGEALEAVDQAAEYTQQAGLGPWTQLAERGRRLQVLRLMGEHQAVLNELAGLRAAMAELPARSAAHETIAPWNVREGILGTGHTSALAAGEWQLCLDLNAEIAASKKERGAVPREVARSRLHDAAPLIKLGRLAEADRLLAECQRIFEEHADTVMLAQVFSVRMGLAAEREQWQAAADLGSTVLRLRYARPEPEDIAAGHHNLASSLRELGRDSAAQRAHRLAAALIYQLAGMAHGLANTTSVLAAERSADDDGRLPSTVAEVVAVAEQTEGVRLGALLAALQPEPQAIKDALSGILRPPQATQ